MLTTRYIPIEIVAQLETADHDGYCSAEECEYNTQTVIHRCKVPVELWTNNCNWTQLMPVPYKKTRGGSNWCDLTLGRVATCESDRSPNDLNRACRQAGLGVHQYRYKLVSVRRLPYVFYDQVVPEVGGQGSVDETETTETTGTLLESDY
jgi:hypothetical protein